MSLDASRHLPTPAQAAPSASADQPAWNDPGSLLHGASVPQELTDRQSRQSFVQQLQEREALQQWGETPLPARLPGLLDKAFRHVHAFSVLSLSNMLPTSYTFQDILASQGVQYRCVH